MHPDVIVIGGGHAGCEAALAAARLGAAVLLLTLDPDRVGHISCNPAIGGVAKGQLVREIDALGGMMGRAADANSLHFRMLNSSKGPAVQSPRAQIDRWSYQLWVKNYLDAQPNLAIRADQATGVETSGGRVVGVRTFLGGVIPCRAAVICSGTFARGKLHMGAMQWPGGRAGEPSASPLSESLLELGLPLFRLRTGTCPRIDGRTVDFAAMTREEGDAVAKPFSFLNEAGNANNANNANSANRANLLNSEAGANLLNSENGANAAAVAQPGLPNLPCYATWTTEETFELVRANLHLAPIVTGAVAGAGPRYCPNFETKVALFPEKKRHHLFVEPEGRHSPEMYLNGLYLSLPAALQERVVRSVPGLGKARIVRYGYSVEYDAVRATELRDTLEAKRLAGLFFAGQVNGTSGYEEAAAQGLLAGANAALAALERPPFRLGRDQAYIGVLVDDLTSRGVEEPYRLFTSRAEYRLLLRQDNADLRLTPLAARIGLADPERLARVEALEREMVSGRALLRSLRLPGGESLEQVLRRPETTVEALCAAWPELAALSERSMEQLGIEAKYEGYIARHLRQIQHLEKRRSLRLPLDFDYAALDGLSREAKEMLTRIRPENLDQAMRLSGVSPADAALLLVRLGKTGTVPGER